MLLAQDARDPSRGRARGASAIRRATKRLDPDRVGHIRTTGKAGEGLSTLGRADAGVGVHDPSPGRLASFGRSASEASFGRAWSIEAS